MSVAVNDPKATMKSQWDAVAPGWDRWFEWYERNFAPSIAFCCDATQLQPGSFVLDVACGTGQPAVAAARRVRPGGRVIATDISPEMLDVARRRAAQAGLANLEFREMDGEHLDFPDETFDAVTCAYALMFYPDVDPRDRRGAARPQARRPLRRRRLGRTVEESVPDDCRPRGRAVLSRAAAQCERTRCVSVRSPGRARGRASGRRLHRRFGRERSDGGRMRVAERLLADVRRPCRRRVDEGLPAERGRPRHADRHG